MKTPFEDSGIYYRNKLRITQHKQDNDLVYL